MWSGESEDESLLNLNFPAASFEPASVNEIAPILKQHAVHHDELIGDSEEVIMSSMCMI